MKYEALDPRLGTERDQDDTELFFRGCASALWEIEVVRSSSWNGHIPFMFLAFQLMRPRRYVELGCHDGGSLFAACQATERLDSNTECVAIDTWTGDAHSGFYGPEVLDNLRQDLSAAGFGDAVLEQALFDDAVADFDDGSIDLLLIDGLHTYEAVKRDLETWLPKVVDGGLIMLHDTRVHERDFGVWKLWQELQVDHTTWEFSHAHGLGLVVKRGGKNQISQFLDYVRNDAAAAAHLQGLLETLAERSVSHNQIGPANQRATVWHERAIELEGELAEEHDRATELTSLDVNDSERSALSDEIDSLRTQLLTVGDERAQLVTDVGARTTELLALGDQHHAMNVQLETSGQQVESLQQQVSILEDTHRSERAQLVKKVESLRAQLSVVGEDRNHERAELVQQIDSLWADVLALGDERAAVRSHYESMKVVKAMRRYWSIRNR